MRWLRDLLNDPVSGKPSATRASALLLTFGAIYAIHLKLDAATVGAVIAGGVVALLTRSRSDDAPRGGA